MFWGCFWWEIQSLSIQQAEFLLVVRFTIAHLNISCNIIKIIVPLLLKMN